MGFPGGSDGKNSAYSVGDLGSIPGLGNSPGEGQLCAHGERLLLPQERSEHCLNDGKSRCTKEVFLRV